MMKKKVKFLKMTFSLLCNIAIFSSFVQGTLLSEFWCPTIIKKSKYDYWFIREIDEIVKLENTLKKKFDLNVYKKCKAAGFSDHRILALSKVSPNKLKDLKKN